MFTSVGLIALAGLIACDRSGADRVPQPSDEFPGVIEVGDLQIITPEQVGEFQDEGASWCDDPDSDSPRCLYLQLGAPDQGKKGGATFTFNGTGDDVCIIVDPETVSWNQSVAAEGPNPSYLFPDTHSDDGDIDLFVGLSSYYNGSPGVELGDFSGSYTDSLGREIQINYEECFQLGSQGQDDAHAGRAYIEYCTIDTQQREGAQYTVVMETWSVPIDDGVLSFAAMAVEGNCSRLGGVSLGECTMMGESLENDGSVRACSEAMEYAACSDQLTQFCCANPEMCGEEPEGVCAEIDIEAFCAATPSLCCGS